MRYNRLGQTGLLVSELCLGTMTFGGSEGMWKQIGSLQQEDADRLIRVAHEAGVNFIDTADVYAEGLSEIMTGQSIRNLGLNRDELVIATKVFGPVGPGPNSRGSSRYHIMNAVKASLRRLQLDHIDLYQLHGFDPLTPVEETMRAMDDLVRDGLVRYVGVSNWAAWQIMKAQGIAQKMQYSRIESLQAYYSIAGRDLERELVPMMQSEQVGLMVWSPLAGGLLTGKYDRASETGHNGRRSEFDFPPVDPDRGAAVIAAMRPIAGRHGVSVAQIALAWLLHQPSVTSIIIGANREAQLIDNIAATNVQLTADELATLNACSLLPSEYPGWMFDLQRAYRAD
ncbi:aldo/keto reductase [Aquisediminimonas sediminicola]|uniref:aldo/keto reductase n=1 Tax=Alteraquisediminimonas sediminicola TaxID=2676787 RepID=UPI001C8ED8BB|nr:aldo/keto reductase [Aquisediminimonas sediminicola]